ncbi:MAG: ATP-grasp domain-containing protein [bacterium]
MKVLMLSPGFPAEMPYFTRGLAEVGATVIGLGDQPEGALPELARRHLSAYVHVRSFADEDAVRAEARRIAAKVRIDRVECLFELVMVLGAKIREDLGMPGLGVEQTIAFRDKEIMKQRLDEAGIRTPRHANAFTAGEVRDAAERIGFPLVVKPIAGAGSQDTYRLDGPRDLEAVIPALRHVDEVSVEEFIEAEDYTFDTVCVDGKVLYYNIAYYRPRALVGRQHAWISPQTICRRDVDSDWVAHGRKMGFDVLKALDFRTGFTHMEWFRRDDGTAVFGEIGARAPGVRTVDLMNFASDIDLFRGWAEAACHGRFTQPVERKYFSAGIFKRAQGSGIVRKIEGLDRILAEYGDYVCAVDLTPVGHAARDWRRSVLADGFVMLRHPDLESTLRMADRVATDVQLYAA